MYRFLVTTAFLFFLITKSNAQEVKPQNYIDASGVAERIIDPNRIWIKISFSVWNDEADKGEKSAVFEDKRSKVKLELSQKGIDTNQLLLSDAVENYTGEGRSRRYTIYNLIYIIEVNSKEKVRAIFEVCNKHNISAKVARINHTAIDSLNRLVEIEATKNAKKKVDFMLESVGEKAGKPIVIHESENNTFIYSDQTRYDGGKDEEYLDDDNVVDYFKIKIKIIVYVKYEIKRE